MNEYQIGKVIGVFGDKIDIALLDFIEENDICIGVPENMCINYQTNEGPSPILIGQPGSFIQISLPNGYLLSMISDIRMREGFPTSKEIRESEVEDDYFLESPQRFISAVPIGTIDPSGRFERGTDILPTVNTPVYAVHKELINNIYKNYAIGDFSIGKLSLIPEQDAKIDLDVFLGRHAVILGQTGGGKSWTVASILQKIAEFPRSTVVLFDLHGEYKSAFNSEFVDFIDANGLEFPYWLMNFQELADLMIDRSEFTAPNQIAKFREILQEAKNTYEENVSLDIPKITVDTPVFFNFQKIIEELKRLDVEKVPGVSGRPKNGPYHGHFTRLIMRIESKLNDKRFNLIFRPEKYKTSASMEKLFRKILGETIDAPKKIVIIDISPIPMEVRNSVLSLILRCIFDFGYWYKRINEKTYPIAVFFEEAHSYLNENERSMESTRLSAEKIAKEGRKYGISLTVVSQRPREVSATILSQCNSFMCLRITNPDDQFYVKRLLPDSIRGIVSIFSTLRRGECILLGDSIMMPTRIKINKPDPTPLSDDTSFFNEWKKEHEEIDVNSVLNAWRKQED
jgi:DNA helicase HerA-like ATPase